MSRRKTTRQKTTSPSWSTIFATLIIAVVVLVLLYFFVPRTFNNAMTTAQELTGVPFTEYFHAEEKMPTQQPTTKPDKPYTEAGTEDITNTVPESAPTHSYNRHEDTPYTEAINMPSGRVSNQIVSHQSYSLSYADEYEQAEWVFYLLTQEMVRGNAKRTDKFVEDESVDLGSALSSDYTSSGYDRGHLCPSADVRHSNVAQQETFYMSNMSPQAPQFNRGIWKKLEEQVRDWVMIHDSIYVATGPVLRKGLKRIGRKNKVAVPEQYYKILYTPRDGGHMIGYLLPNEGSDEETAYFIESVDNIESATGINFFEGIRNEDSLESRHASPTWWKKR